MEVVYIFETKNSKNIQDCVIAQIKQHRYKKRKDFYEIDINLLKNIIKDCTDMTKKYSKSLTKKQDGGGLNNLYIYIKKIN
jgi:hypothetical protein